MKKQILQAAVIASIALATACGNNTNENTSTMATTDSSAMTGANDQSMQDTSAMAGTSTDMNKDQDFMMEAASGGMMEVELGKIAGTNASSSEVKMFGKQMVTDHSKANDELKSLAAKKNITLPSSPNEKHQAHINDMKEKKGADFDKAYMSLMVDDHNEDVKKFGNEANDGGDADIKAFAAGVLPVLKKHQDMAKSINGKMK